MLRKELINLASACGELHPAVVPLERFDILDGLSTRSARGVFGYEPGWGLPSERERDEIRKVMGEIREARVA